MGSHNKHNGALFVPHVPTF